MLKTRRNNLGYVKVTLYKPGKPDKWGNYPGKKTESVHRLVAMAFNGPIPAKLEVNHKNGVKHDNRPENLEYVTHRENMLHAHRLGLFPPVPKGKASPRYGKKASSETRERMRQAKLGSKHVRACVDLD